MKRFLPAFGIICLLIATSLGDETNGLLLTAQKTVLGKTKNRESALSDYSMVKRDLALKVEATNTSLTDMPEGSITCTIIVKRRDGDYEKYTDTQPFPPLKASAETRITIGKVKTRGLESSGDRRDEDAIAGWEIVVKHNNVVTAKLTSGGGYEKLLGESKTGSNDD